MHNLRQFLFSSFWRWFLRSFFSARTTSAFLNFTVLSQNIHFLLIYPTWKIWYPPLCIIWKKKSPAVLPADAVCGWSVPAIPLAHVRLVFLLELLHLLQWHLSDQVNKLLQCDFILLYVIVQMVKVSVAILTKAFFQLKTFRKLTCLYKLLFQKIVTWVDWGHVKISYLFYDMINSNRTIQ